MLSWITHLLLLDLTSAHVPPFHPSDILYILEPWCGVFLRWRFLLLEVFFWIMDLMLVYMLCYSHTPRVLSISVILYKFNCMDLTKPNRGTYDILYELDFAIKARFLWLPRSLFKMAYQVRAACIWCHNEVRPYQRQWRSCIIDNCTSLEHTASRVVLKTKPHGHINCICWQPLYWG